MALLLKSETNIDIKTDDSDTTDDEIYDDYKPDKHKQLLASSNRGLQQNDTPAQSSARTLEKVNREPDIDEIQWFIGQICITYKDLSADSYYYGTGTTCKHLGGKYYVVLTCAHNLLRKKDQPATQLFYLPKGKNISEEDERKEKNMQKEMRLQCIKWQYYDKYNPDMMHCQNDIGIILCYDARKYYKKLKLDEDINDIIDIAFSKNKKKLKYCNIYGYPVDCPGILMGSKGSAKRSKDNVGEWEYKIHTFPGESGSALYVWNDDEEKFRIYGVHTFGDVVQQINIGVKLTEEHYNWINNTIEQVMIPAMNDHKTMRAEKKKQKSSDLQLFLETIGLGQYYKNFTDRGCDKMNDLIEAELDSNDLKDEFLITEWKHRKQILKGVKAYFGNDNDSKEQYESKIEEKVNDDDHKDDNKNEHLIEVTESNGLMDKLFENISQSHEYNENDIKQLKQFLSSNEYDSDSLYDDISSSNPFIFSNFKSKAKNKSIQNSVDDKLAFGTEYQVGFHFYYWDFYKNNEDTLKPSPQHTHVIKKKELFVEPKYNNFKQEALNNKIAMFSLYQWNKTHTKATTKLQAWNNDETVKNISAAKDKYHYGIQEGTPISINHIMSLLCYCNYSQQGFNFTRTFRRQYYEEPLRSVKKRNQEVRCWSKLLKETVCCFGTRFGDSDIQVLYFAIKRQYIPSTIVCLAAPVETTPDFQKAAMDWGSNGLVLEFKLTNQPAEVKYFNTNGWSKYSSEEMKLLFGCQFPIQIYSIRDILQKKNHQLFCSAFSILHNVLAGSQLDKATKKIVSAYNALTEKITNQQHHKSLDGYLQKQFDAFCKSRRQIILNLHKFKQSNTTFHDVFINSIKEQNEMKQIDNTTNLIKKELIDLFNNVYEIIIVTTSEDGKCSYPFDMLSLLAILNSSQSSATYTISIHAKPIRSNIHTWIRKTYKKSMFLLQAESQKGNFEISFKRTDQMDCFVIKRQNSFSPQIVHCSKSDPGDGLPKSTPDCIEFKWNKNTKTKKDCDTKHLLYLLQEALEPIRIRTIERNKYFESIGRIDKYINHLDAPRIITNILDWCNKNEEVNKFNGEILDKADPPLFIKQIL
eukprot:140858_1